MLIPTTQQSTHRRQRKEKTGVVNEEERADHLT